jgi:hypothetical protein
MHEEQIRAWWESENGLEDCNMCRWADFSLVVRAVEQKLASLAKPQPVGGALTAWREECEAAPAALFTGAKVLMFSQEALIRIGSAIEAATLSAPVAQSGEAVSEDRLRKALTIIANWTLPATGKFWDEEQTRPTSYEAEYGSNGARDYMRNLAAQTLLATPIAAQPAAAEPVLYQSRMRPGWRNATGWTDWENCSAGTAADYERTPVLHDWHYEVRRLYLAAPAQAAAVPEAVERVFEQWWLKSAPAAEFYRMLRAALSQGDVSGEGEGA